MSMDPLADIVAGQYEQWVYPEPIRDLPGWLVNNWQWFDPSHAHCSLWPESPNRVDLRILVAGCGTNQAAVIAYTNPGASVTGIDVSEASLDHHRFLKTAYSLDNLNLRRLPIEEVKELGDNFDLIISTGVLHHLADPDAGLAALADVLAPDGVIALMLYATTGRLGVELMEAAFRDAGLGQTPDDIALVRDALDVLPDRHPLRAYLAFAPDLNFDAGLVDTFLHGRQRSYTTSECLKFVQTAGLQFGDWFFHAPYEPSTGGDNNFLARVGELPDAQRWAVMERINTNNACHFFTARRDGRVAPARRRPWETMSARDIVPVWRYRCSLRGSALERPGWQTTAHEDLQQIASLIDNQRSVAEIVELSGLSSTESLLDWLWHADFVTFTYADN